MKTIPKFEKFALLLVTLLGAVTATPRADVVTDWNVTATTAAAAPVKNGIVQTRIYAMMHAAVHDALNAIDRRDKPYVLGTPANPAASPEAAVAAAAHAVLINELPAAQYPFLDAAYADSLSKIPDGNAKTNGITTGIAAAAAIIALRSSDGSAAPMPYTPGTGPGVWIPTPADFLPAAVPGWGQVTPFVLQSGRQFRLDRPVLFDLTSKEYAAAYNEVKSIGAVNSATRTAEQSQIAQFWYEPSVQGWNRLARVVSEAQHLDLWENARLFELLNFALADAYIAHFDTKYLYNFWRPITAIRAGDTDGNNETVADANWASFLVTPNIPDYPSGHSTAGAAAATVLAGFFGKDEVPFTTTSGAPFPGITRSFTSFSEAAQENADSRVFAGIHFRIATTDGLRLGKQVGAYVTANAAQRLSDEALDWNAILRRSIVATPAAGGAPGFRLAAIVQASVFDAVNGIDRQFTPIHVSSPAPQGASRRAAAVSAAYTALVALFPAQSDALAKDLETSLASIAADVPNESSAAIASGRAWGEQVAKEILAWRSTDGLDPSPSTYTGSQEPGQWRPTPPALANGFLPSLAHTLPWVIPNPSSFRPPGPPALTSAKYTADFSEEKAVGELTSDVRTPDQTLAARFWAGTALTFWNRAAASAAVQRHLTLSENARLFALLNVAMADGGISCWDAKYFYNFWRPITAIRLASTDGNPETVEQADWTPLIVTPPYPDYSSGHASVSGAGQAVLTSYFGNDMPVEGWSEGLGESTVRGWPNFSAAADEANLARVWAGIHFRFAVVDARAAGNAIGAYVMANAAQARQTQVVLQHTDGSVAFWTMDGTTVVEGIVPYVLPAGWQIVGAGDFNHDDQSDLVLQHTDRSVAFWMMQGTTITTGLISFHLPEGWNIVATGDFNRDGQTDLVLQNVNGRTAFWFLNGTSVMGIHPSRQLAAGWRIAGAGRFGHSAATDIVLQSNDGSVAFWLMDGTTIVSDVVGDQIPAGWKIAATGNYNLDQETDIVLEHTDGSVAFWLMNGTTITQGVVPYVVPAGWQVVGPR